MNLFMQNFLGEISFSILYPSGTLTQHLILVTEVYSDSKRIDMKELFYFWLNLLYLQCLILQNRLMGLLLDQLDLF